MNIHKLSTKTKQPKASKTIKWIIPSEILNYVKKNLIHGKFIVERELYYNLKKLNL